MAEKEDGGIMGQIRRLSRRLSGNILSADPKDVRAYMSHNESKRNIYSYDNEDQLRIGGILLKDLAEEYGTPLYIYDINRIYDNYNLLAGVLKTKNFLLSYSVRANSNLAILNIFSRLGSGFDVASGGEIARCLAAGVDPSRITFSGCGKTNDEIDLAIKSGIYCINAESWDELNRIENVCVKYNKIQNVSIRINADTHSEGAMSPSLHGHSTTTQSKYGVPIADALEIYSRVKASSTMRIKGISCRVGTHVTHLESYLEIRDRLLHLADELRQESKICVEHIDFGGEFVGNLNAMNADATEISNWIEKIASPILERGLKLVLDPGINFMADAGVLLTKIEYVKTNTSHSKESYGGTSPKTGSFISSHAGHHLKHHSTKRTFAVVDAGFNDFVRTAMLGQNHHIVPVHQQQSVMVGGVASDFKYDIVGPITDAADVFCRDFSLNYKLAAGDYLIISDAGSYGSSMSSNFQSRNKLAEILIIERQPIVIRERQKYEEQYSNEKLVPELKLNSSKIIEEAESQEELLQQSTTNTDEGDNENKE